MSKMAEISEWSVEIQVGRLLPQTRLHVVRLTLADDSEIPRDLSWGGKRRLRVAIR